MKCNGTLIGDLKTHEEQFMLSMGGAGGYGNIHFKSALNRRPLQFTKGEPGEEKAVELELKTIADIGLVRDGYNSVEANKICITLLVPLCSHKIESLT